MPKLNRYGKDGGHFGFMQIRKNAQGCQAGTRRILAQEHLGTSNPSKNKSYTTIPGSPLWLPYYYMSVTEHLTQGWANFLTRGPQWVLKFDRGARPGTDGKAKK